MNPKVRYFILVFVMIACVALMLLMPVLLLDDWSSLSTDPTGTSQTGTTATGQTDATTGTTSAPSAEAPTTSAPTTVPTEPPVVQESTFTLSATGDMLMHSPVFDAAATGSGYDFSSVFTWFSEYVSAADYAAGNLETTLAGTDNGYSYSGYPNFNCPDAIIDGMKAAGFDLVLTANNHTYDTRTTGFHRTLEVIADRQLDHLGTQADAEEADYLLIERNGITLGLLCYTYETDGTADGKSLNGIPVSDYDLELVSSFDYSHLELFYAELGENISEMKDLGAEAIVVFMHWGDEYHLEQNATQSAIAQKLCDLGVDVIIGGHPHVVQPVELLTSTVDETRKTVCLYSMGNAVSNQRQGYLDSISTAHTEDGVLFSVTFGKYSDGTVRLESCQLIPTWVNMRYNSEGRKEYNILPLAGTADEWQARLSLSGDTLAKARASYDRTMAIVGEGMAEVESYLAQKTEG